MDIIEAEHYEHTRLRLIADPVVLEMAEGLTGVPLDQLQDETGHPVFQFIQAANREYASRSNDDTGPRHIGAVAEALLRLRLLKAD